VKQGRRELGEHLGRDITISPATAFRSNSCAMRCFSGSLTSYAYTRTLVSRKSGPGIEIFPFPGSLSYPELNLPETALERLALPPHTPGESVLGHEIFEKIAD